MSKEYNLLDDANQHVTAYVEERFCQDLDRLEKIDRGESCDCPTCMHSAVAEMNLWINWLVEDDGGDWFDFYTVELDENERRFIRKNYGKHLTSGGGDE